MNELKDFEPVLKADDVELRWLEPNFQNAKMLFDAYTAERPEYFRYYGDMTEIAPSPEQIFLNMDYGHTKDKNKRDYGIFLNNEFIGCINIGIWNLKASEIGLGIWLKEKDSIRGLLHLPKAASMFESELWRRGVNRINYQCDTNNVAAQKLAEALGYKFEGIARQVLVYENGRMGDAKNYAKVKSDIINQKSEN